MTSKPYSVFVLLLIVGLGLAACTPTFGPTPAPLPVTVVVTVVTTPTVPAPEPTATQPAATAAATSVPTTVVPTVPAATMAPTAAATATASATALPPSPAPTNTAVVKQVHPTRTPGGPTAAPCSITPGSAFAPLWSSGLQPELGCPKAGELTLLSAFQTFERGVMLWREDTKQVHVLYEDGTWEAFADTWVEGEPEYSCPAANTPSDTPPTPMRGFGKLWCSQPDVRQKLGNVTGEELGQRRRVQDFQTGSMWLVPEYGARPVVLYADGYWTGP